MSPDVVFWLAMAGLVVTCFAAIGARSLSEFSRHDLEELCHKKGLSDRLGQILRKHDHVSLAAETLQVVATAIVVLAGAFWTLHLAAEPSWTLLGSSIVVGAFLLLAVEIWIPWAISRLWATRFVFTTWPFWTLVNFFLSPLVLGARFVDTVLHRIVGRVHEEPNEESFEDEIRTIVTEGHREGLLEEDAREMIEGVIELSDVDVSEIMTPRTDMISVPISLSWQEMIEFVIESGHTRIPVYEKNRDDIIGILVARDLLPELAKNQTTHEKTWNSLLRDPYFVPETKGVDVLLQEFQKTGNHLAIVLDEYGGVSGIVSMEDVLEEIVGEIIDEYDKDPGVEIKHISDGVAELLGGVHIDDINEQLKLDLPDDDDFDTIAGLVFSELGHIPIVGEELMFGKVRITVLEATRRRILRVRIETPEQTQRVTA